MTRLARVLSAAAALLGAALVAALALEAWVRWRWDERKGRPGFYVSDPVLGQRLAPGYAGWFAGVPVRINNLGFRDDRDHELAKPPGVFRILVLGDSVTFGHGTSQRTTYPHLLGQRLAEWRPDIEWQVWNLGVPGYATGQELALLERVGPAYDPDLVVVGFFSNDLSGNIVDTAPGAPRRASSALQRAMQRHLYSYELYRRVLLTLAFRFSTDAAGRRRLERLSDDEELLARADSQAAEREPAPGVDRIAPEEVEGFRCPGDPPPDPSGAEEFRAMVAAPDAEMRAWLAAVRGLQRLARERRYHLVFFINMAPKVCESQDRFYDAGELAMDAALTEVLAQGVPVASSTRAFLAYRPSQMPLAGGHSAGNANRVKADALFDVLQSAVLPPLLSRPR